MSTAPPLRVRVPALDLVLLTAFDLAALLAASVLTPVDPAAGGPLGPQLLLVIAPLVAAMVLTPLVVVRGAPGRSSWPLLLGCAAALVLLEAVSPVVLDPQLFVPDLLR